MEDGRVGKNKCAQAIVIIIIIIIIIINIIGIEQPLSQKFERKKLYHRLGKKPLLFLFARKVVPTTQTTFVP